MPTILALLLSLGHAVDRSRVFKTADDVEFQLRAVGRDVEVIRITGGAREVFRARATRDAIGGATDYTFADGTAVIHAPDRTEPRGVRPGGPPRLIERARGRTELIEIGAPVHPPPGVIGRFTSPEEPVRRPTAGNHSAAMIHFTLPDTEHLTSQLAVFEAESTSTRPPHFTFNDALGRGRREITMWVARGSAVLLAERVRRVLGAETRIRERLLDDRDHARAPEDFPTDATPLTYRVLEFRRYLDARDAGRSTDSAIDAGVAVRHHVRETRRLLEQVRDVSQRLGRYSHSAMAKADLEADFEAPLLELMRRGFEALHELGGEQNVRSILHGWPDVVGFPQTYLARAVRGDDRTYFDHWTSQLAEELDRVPARLGDHAPPIEEYVALGVYPLRMADVFDLGGRGFSTWPVFALGLSIGDQARDQLRRQVLHADEISARVHERFDGRGIDGAAFVPRLLEAIATGPERSYDANYAVFNFPPAPYYARAAQLFADLLEDGRFLVRTPSTYLLLVSNALRLRRAIEWDYPNGVVSERADDGAAAPDLGLQLTRLQNAIALDQARQVVALSLVCEDALRPR